MSGGWTKQIDLGNGDVMVSAPKSSCKAAKGSRYNSMPVKEMKHSDPLLSTEIHFAQSASLSSLSQLLIPSCLSCNHGQGGGARFVA